MSSKQYVRDIAEKRTEAKIERKNISKILRMIFVSLEKSRRMLKERKNSMEGLFFRAEAKDCDHGKHVSNVWQDVPAWSRVRITIVYLV